MWSRPRTPKTRPRRHAAPSPLAAGAGFRALWVGVPPRRDPRLPLLRRLARLGLNPARVQRAAHVPLAWLRELVANLKAPDSS